MAQALILDSEALRRDAALNRVLAMKGIVVAELTERIARRAGHLLARAKLSSSHAVDVFVVATALDFPESMIATGDPADIQRLGAGFKQLRTFRICVIRRPTRRCNSRRPRWDLRRIAAASGG